MSSLGTKLQKACFKFYTVHIGWHSATCLMHNREAKSVFPVGKWLLICNYCTGFLFFIPGFPQLVISWKMALLTDFSVSEARFWLPFYKTPKQPCLGPLTIVKNHPLVSHMMLHKLNSLYAVTLWSLNVLTLRWLMSYIYGAPTLDVSRSHTTTQHSR